MNRLEDIKRRLRTLHGEGYWTQGGSKTEAANDVGFLLEKLEEMTGWRNELGFRYNQTKRAKSKSMNPESKKPWAARLWAAKDAGEYAFAAIVFPDDTRAPIGFGLGSAAHRALDAACADIGLNPFTIAVLVGPMFTLGTRPLGAIA